LILALTRRTFQRLNASTDGKKVSRSANKILGCMGRGDQFASLSQEDYAGEKNRLPGLNFAIGAAPLSSVPHLAYGEVVVAMSQNTNLDPEELLRRARTGSGPDLGQLLELYRKYLILLARLQIGRRLQGKVDAA